MADTDDPLAVHRLAADVLARLAAAGATLATAESLTGGLLAARITDVPGASTVFRGALVCYATDLKTSVLGVPPEVVAEHGVISAPCARAMAEGGRRVAGTTYAVSTTGVAGPDGQDGKPPGTVFVAVAGPAGVEVRELALDDDRAAIRELSCREALTQLARVVLGAPSGDTP